MAEDEAAIYGGFRGVLTADAMWEIMCKHEENFCEVLNLKDRVDLASKFVDSDGDPISEEWVDAVLNPEGETPDDIVTS